jgi:fatty-acyl-CoA synthase
MTHLFQPLLRRAAVEPDRVFCTLVTDKEESSFTVSDIVGSASSVGDSILRHNIQSKSLVLIMIDHTEYLYSAFIGTILAGAIPSFIAPLTAKQNATIYQEALFAVFKRINPSLIITSKKFISLFPETDVPIILVEDLSPPGVEAMQTQAERAARINGNDIAFLQHSSGTTGLKKGVMLSHDAVLEQCKLYAEAIKIDVCDTIVSWLPLYHDMGLIASFILPAIVGTTIISLGYAAHDFT